MAFRLPMSRLTPLSRCSHFLPAVKETAEPRPCVIYLHQNASCRRRVLRRLSE